MTPGQALLERPTAFVRPACLRACFGGALAQQHLDALAGQGRFQARLDRLLAEHHGLPPLSARLLADPADLSVIALDAAGFAALPSYCGALWHGAALAREIRGTQVQALKQHLGAEAFAFALRHRDERDAATPGLEGAALLEAIDRAGQACVGAWLQAQPEALQGWLRLRFEWPPQTLGDCPPQAVERVRRVAGLLQENGERVP